MNKFYRNELEKLSNQVILLEKEKVLRPSFSFYLLNFKWILIKKWKEIGMRNKWPIWKYCPTKAKPWKRK